MLLHILYLRVLAEYPIPGTPLYSNEFSGPQNVSGSDGEPIGDWCAVLAAEYLQFFLMMFSLNTKTDGLK